MNLRVRVLIILALCAVAMLDRVIVPLFCNSGSTPYTLEVNLNTSISYENLILLNKNLKLDKIPRFSVSKFMPAKSKS